MSLFGETEQEAWGNLSKEISKGIEPNTIYKSLTNFKEHRANEIKIASTPLLETESIRIINKDSSNLSEEISDDSVDCIPTSPPYFLKIRKYDSDIVNEGNSLGEEETMEEFIDNRMKILRECKRMIKETGSIFINIMDQRKNGKILRVDSKLCDAFEEEGLVLVNRMIWFKNNPVYESNNGFQKSMEYVLHFVKDPQNYKWRTDWLDSTSTFLGNVTYGDIGTKRKIRDVVSYDFPYDDGSFYVSGKLNTNVINNNFLIKLLKKKGYYLSHNALFPLEVPLICVMSTTDPGDLVVDVWGGLSTTGLIAYANNCRYIGVDQSLEYSAMASVRLKDFIEKYSPIERVYE
jgi:site-specific DNA-methyltransferase (adenine-specific)